MNIYCPYSSNSLVEPAVKSSMPTHHQSKATWPTMSWMMLMMLMMLIMMVMIMIDKTMPGNGFEGGWMGVARLVALGVV